MLSELTHTSIEDFPLKWRFLEAGSSLFLPEHEPQIKPLDSLSASRVSKYIDESGLHDAMPFQVGFFRNIESICFPENYDDELHAKRVRKWLYTCAIPFDAKIILSWDSDCAIETSWKMLMKYWPDFYYSISDDLTVIDGSLTWALLFFHEHELFFGTNHPRIGTEQGGAGQPATRAESK